MLTCCAHYIIQNLIGKSSCSEGRGHGSSKVRSINPDMINGAEKNEKLRLCNINQHNLLTFQILLTFTTNTHRHLNYAQQTLLFIRGNNPEKVAHFNDVLYLIHLFCQSIVFGLPNLEPIPAIIAQKVHSGSVTSLSQGQQTETDNQSHSNSHTEFKITN